MFARRSVPRTLSNSTGEKARCTQSSGTRLCLPEDLESVEAVLAIGGPADGGQAAIVQSITTATHACCSASSRRRYGDQPRRRSAIDTSATSPFLIRGPLSLTILTPSVLTPR